jgi:hypothetical protein
MFFTSIIKILDLREMKNGTKSPLPSEEGTTEKD